MYKLIIEDDEGKTTVVPLVRDEITIGRKEGNTIRLTERNVSRRHAKLVRSNGSVQIEDLQSHNGIKINGDRIAGRAPVSEGDRIQIGDYQLALKVDKAASAPGGERGDEKTTPFFKEQEKAPADAPTRAQPVISATPEADRPARLVVVSSNFAGQEFPLDKAAVVIGRTDENDVVVNHRSISRHHAKIVREAGHYHVVDLQSANGVRVNGEEYGKVELRKGDHIDLGHVRLRFIAPGEDFVFERDAKVVEVAGDKKGKTGLFIGLAAAVVLLAGGGFLVMKMLGGDKGGGGGGGGKVDDVKTLRLNKEIDNAVAAREWDGCASKADEILTDHPTDDAVRSKKAKCDSEKKNKTKFEDYSKAAKDGDNDRAVTAHQELSEDSTYLKQAEDTWGMVKRAYIKEHLGSAKAEQGANRCEQARQHVEKVLLIDEGNTDAQEVAKKCGQTPAVTPIRPVKPGSDVRKPVVGRPPVVAAANPVKPPPVAPPPVEAPKPPPVEAPKPAADTDGMIKDAMSEYVNGNYQKAIELARKANASGNNPKAWRIIGASFCFQKNHDEAAKAWNHLGAMDRQFIKYVCDRNQIKLP